MNRFLKNLRWPALLWMLALTACSEPPAVSLTGEERALIDTLYIKEVESLRTRLDSMCDSLTVVEVPRLRDSLVENWLEEAARLRQQPLNGQNEVQE